MEGVEGPRTNKNASPYLLVFTRVRYVIILVGVSRYCLFGSVELLTGVAGKY
jgi:hypothetical protein